MVYKCQDPVVVQVTLPNANVTNFTATSSIQITQSQYPLSVSTQRDNNNLYFMINVKFTYKTIRSLHEYTITFFFRVGYFRQYCRRARSGRSPERKRLHVSLPAAARREYPDRGGAQLHGYPEPTVQPRAVPAADALA